LRVRLGGRTIELDQNVARGDARAVEDMQRRDLAGLQRFDDLDAAGRLELALRDRDDVDPAEKRPGDRCCGERSDDPDQRDANRRGRGLEDFERGREERVVGPPPSGRRRAVRAGLRDGLVHAEISTD
jgi:hypothetical protein